MTGEEIKKNLLSDDASTILHTAHDILYMSTMNVKERESVLNDAYLCLDEIKEHVKDMEFGGAILPNKRFVYRALSLIEQSKDGQCKCMLAFDGYGQDESTMQECYGFRICFHELDGYIERSIIQCPCCKTFYEIENEYTGWHVNTFRHRKIASDDERIKI